MSKKDKTIVEFMEGLLVLRQTEYEKAKATLLSVECNNKNMTDFLNKSFSLAEKYRPKLLEMKGGVVNA